jgi:Protein of unknown function (DUF3306)
VSDEPNGTLSRWSQRKLAARRGAVIDEPPPEKQPVAEQAPPATAGEQNSAAKAADSEGEIPELPPIDELTFQSDYTGFLHKSVPEALRRAALRKLWASDPVLANLDGLNDYCEDFNVIDTPITLAQTSYKVGRGYLDEIKDAVTKLEPENVGEVDAKRIAESPPESVARDSESPGAEAGDDSVAEDAAEESRQLAAASPEPGEFPESSGKPDDISPTTSERGQRRGS